MSIFNPDPNLTHDDRERLGHWLANYGHLNEGLVLDQFKLPDLQRLILMELEGKNRKPLLRRLVGRVISAERRRVWRAVLQEQAP